MAGRPVWGPLQVTLPYSKAEACEVYVPPGPGETGAATGAEQVCFTPVDRG